MDNLMHLVNVMVIPLPKQHVIHVELHNEDGDVLRLPIKAWPYVIDVGRARVHPFGIPVRHPSSECCYSSAVIQRMYQPAPSHSSDSFPFINSRVWTNLIQSGRIEWMTEFHQNMTKMIDDLDSHLFNAAVHKIAPRVSASSYGPLLYRSMSIGNWLSDLQEAMVDSSDYVRMIQEDLIDEDLFDRMEQTRQQLIDLCRTHVNEE